MDAIANTHPETTIGMLLTMARTALELKLET
jgi:hypothetical protein